MGGEAIAFFQEAFERLFVTIGPPISALVLFAALADGLPRKERHILALKSCGLSLGLLLVFALSSGLVFRLLGLPLCALQIAGGLLLLLLAQSTLFSQLGLEPKPLILVNAQAHYIFPLSFPLIAGPGALTQSLLLYEEAAGTLSFQLSILAAAMLILLGYYLAFVFSRRLLRILTPSGVRVFVCMVALLLAALASQMMLAGLNTAFA